MAECWKGFMEVPGTRVFGAAVALCTALAGCQYAGPADNAIARNLTWFSYIGGEDIEKSCVAGAENRYRFVYNGIYEKQIRAYDVDMLPGGRGAAVSAFARAEPNLAQSLTVEGVGAQWGGTRAQATMSLQGLAELEAALRADRLVEFKPAGLRMASDEFYWIAVACIDGRFHANAWIYPTERFNALKFPDVLQEYDRTGIAFYAARPEHLRDGDRTQYRGSMDGQRPFNVQLGANGIVGAQGFF
ncbi:MAG: hypothetical protein WD470_00885 [Rhodospirillaceae bacterium]